MAPETLPFTQGDWKVRFYGGEDDGESMFFVEAPNLNKPELGYGIEILMEDFGEHQGYPRPQRLADAYLVAASPELVKALIKVVSGMTEGVEKDALRAIIRKAFPPNAQPLLP